MAQLNSNPIPQKGSWNKKELYAIAKGLGMKKISKLKKSEIVNLLIGYIESFESSEYGLFMSKDHKVGYYLDKKCEVLEDLNYNFIQIDKLPEIVEKLYSEENIDGQWVKSEIKESYKFLNEYKDETYINKIHLDLFRFYCEYKLMADMYVSFKYGNPLFIKSMNYTFTIAPIVEYDPFEEMDY